MKEIAAGGVVYRRQEGALEIQLIRDRFGRMTLAKGHAEPGETVQETALREIEEETGIVGRIVGTLPGARYGYEREDRTRVEKEVHYFLVEADAGELRVQTSEIAGAGWFAPGESWRLQLAEGYPANDEVLRRALRQLGHEPEGERPAEAGRFPLWLPEQPLAPFIDHTLLKAEARSADFAKLCEEALEHRFFSVCVNGKWVRQCREQLTGSSTKVCAVVGFPLGAGATRAKAFEAAAAVEDGAAEIDMVLPIGKLLDEDYAAVEKDIASVVQAVQGGALVKVILETGALTDALIAEACRLAEAAGADFVKTSTGFGPGGATEAHVRLMRAGVSPRVGVKASGGIRSREDAVKMLLAGASRIGTSSGVKIVAGGEEAPAGAY